MPARQQSSSPVLATPPCPRLAACPCLVLPLQLRKRAGVAVAVRSKVGSTGVPWSRTRLMARFVTDTTAGVLFLKISIVDRSSGDMMGRGLASATPALLRTCVCVQGQVHQLLSPRCPSCQVLLAPCKALSAASGVCAAAGAARTRDLTRATDVRPASAEVSTV